jgi:ATP-dependent Clp protease adaptor protein ClpS
MKRTILSLSHLTQGSSLRASNASAAIQPINKNWIASSALPPRNDETMPFSLPRLTKPYPFCGVLERKETDARPDDQREWDPIPPLLHDADIESDAALLVQTTAVQPPKYKVVMLNDDYTPMEFVVVVLERIFRKSHEEALMLMLEVHQKGSAICGVYTREVAETKVEEVLTLAQSQQHPLKCVYERE